MIKEAIVMLLVLVVLLGFYASGTMRIEAQEDITLPTLPQILQRPGDSDTTPTVPAATQPPAGQTMTYTQEQLLALSHDAITYGPGTASDGNPAPYAPEAQKLYGKYGAHFIGDAENVIYLTFDCGYEHYLDGKSITAMILDTLKEKNVKAMFFVTASYVDKNPDLVRRILDEGHVLGNHGFAHKSMPSLGIAEMEEQIQLLHDAVKEQFGYAMKFFRPPEGDFSLRSLAVTQNLGYETVHWSFAYADWDTDNQPDPTQSLVKILSCHHDGAIYLLHAVSATNAQVLGDVIDGLLAMGYRLDTLS